MNDDRVDTQAPGYHKMLMFTDLLEYAKKNNILVDRAFFTKHSFNMLEAEWLFENKGEEIQMQNQKIKADLTNEEIIKLKARVAELEKENAGLTNPNTNTIGWKGTNSLTLKKLDKTEWLITEHRKTKGTGKIYESLHYIPVKNINSILNIIKKLVTKDEPTTNYRAVVRELLIKHDIGIDIEAFNGGKNRSKYLFPLYYYPIKILEYLKIVEYGGKGHITLLDFKQVRL